MSQPPVAVKSESAGVKPEPEVIAPSDSKKDVKSDSVSAVAGSGGEAIPDRKSAANWTVPEVGAFIRSLNSHFGEYAKAFEKDSVDGPMLLLDIDSEWIEANIPTALHRNTIKRALTQIGSKSFSAAAAGTEKKSSAAAAGSGGGAGGGSEKAEKSKRKESSGGKSSSGRNKKKKKFDEQSDSESGGGGGGGARTINISGNSRPKFGAIGHNSRNIKARTYNESNDTYKNRDTVGAMGKGAYQTVYNSRGGGSGGGGGSESDGNENGSGSGSGSGGDESDE